MNPNDTPVKFPLNTRVRVSRGFNAGMRGAIIEERRDGHNNHVSFDGGGHAWFSDDELDALPVPEVGDLVRVTKTGRWTAQEGHITDKDKFGMLTVDLEHEYDAPIFEARYLEVIEKVKPKPARIEGQPIKPEAIKRGDKISVVSTDASGEIEKTTILAATVDKIVKKGFNGQHFSFQTRTGSTIHTTEYLSTAVISLVSDIDKDVDFHALSLIKPNEIIGFPDEEGGIEINIAVRQERDWSVMLGAKKSKNMETAGLVAILKKKNVTFSIIRSTPDPLEFPVGTNVKVKGGNPLGLHGDYRVIVAREDVTTIKSRGISATTHTIDNKWLTKG